MTREEQVKLQIIEKFPFLKDAVFIRRERRIFLDAPFEEWADIFEYAVKNMQFNILSAITGLDEENDLEVIYHLSNRDGVMCNLRIRVSKENPVINSVTSYFPAADIYERELMDLLGIKVAGLSEGHRYPLADNWPRDEFPLRKNWKGRKKEDENG